MSSTLGVLFAWSTLLRLICSIFGKANKKYIRKARKLDTFRSLIKTLKVTKFLSSSQWAALKKKREREL